MKKKNETINIDALEIGQKITYGMYSEITFEGVVEDKGEQLVVMKDGSGNTKRVFRYLFEKYARIVK